MKKVVPIHGEHGLDWFRSTSFIEVNDGIVGVEIYLNSGWTKGVRKRWSDGLVGNFIKIWLLSWFG